MDSSIPSKLANFIKPGKLTVFSWTYCPYCVKVKKLLDTMGIKYEAYETDTDTTLSSDQEFLTTLNKHANIRSYPKVYIGTTCIGGCDDTHALLNSGKLYTLLKSENISFKGDEKY